MDKGFILSDDFPKEGNFIFLDNLLYSKCVQVDHTDLSITVYDVPTISSTEERFFTYL